MRRKHFFLPAIALFTLLINLAAYKYLPDRVALQISSGGELRNFVPKMVFVFAVPAVLMLVYFASSMKEPENKFKFILVSAIALVANAVLIYLNLK